MGEKDALLMVLRRHDHNVRSFQIIQPCRCEIPRLQKGVALILLNITIVVCVHVVEIRTSWSIARNQPADHRNFNKDACVRR